VRGARKRERTHYDERGQLVNPARRLKTKLKAQFGITTGRQWKRLQRAMRAEARKP
jgi:hypothetical protein